MCSILILSDGHITAQDAACFQTDGRVEVVDNLSRFNWSSFADWELLQYEYLVIRSRIVSFFLSPGSRHAVVCIGSFSSGQFVHSLGCFHVSSFLGQQVNERIHLVGRVLRSWGLLAMRVRDTWSMEFCLKPFALISLCTCTDFTAELHASLYNQQGRYRDLRSAFPAPITVDQILRESDVVSIVGARPYVVGRVSLITGFALSRGHSMVYGRSSDADKVFENLGKPSSDEMVGGFSHLSPDISRRLSGKFFFGDCLVGRGYSHSLAWGYLSDSGTGGDAGLVYVGCANPDIVFCHTGLREKYLLIKYFLTEKYHVQVLWTDEESEEALLRGRAARGVWEQLCLLGLFSLNEVFWPTSIPWTLRSLLSFMVRAGRDLRQCHLLCRAVSDGKKTRATKPGVSHEGGFVFNLATQFSEVEEADKGGGGEGGGGLPSSGFRWWWKNVVEVDFVSFYPEIIIALGASYPGDPGGLIPLFLRELLRMRRALSADDPKGSAIKLLSNKVYGFISYCFPELGGQITKSARQVLLSCKEHATGLMGAVVVSADTDGIMVHLPRASDPGEFCQRLSALVQAKFSFQIPALKAKTAYCILCLGGAKKAYFGLDASTGMFVESSTVIGRSDYSALGKDRVRRVLLAVLELLGQADLPSESQLSSCILEIVRSAYADVRRISGSLSMPACTLAEQESLLSFQKISGKFVASTSRQPFSGPGKAFLMHALLRGDRSCEEMLDRGLLGSVPLFGFDETLEYAHRMLVETGKPSIDLRSFMEKQIIDPINSVLAHHFAVTKPISFADLLSGGAETQVEIHSENISLKRRDFDLYDFLNN